MNNHEKYMKMALHAAEKGRGFTSPNPVVGAVIVKDEQVIATGYHKVFGKEHAEVNALKEAGSDAINADMYVTLEPCNIFGKTPPCTEAIIKAGINRVFIAVLDPNPKITGKGIKKLEENGIEVETGILESEASAINRGFFSVMEKKRPWVTLKMALTTDGFIADLAGKSQWITSAEARNYVKSQRLLHDSVMVGMGTVIKDNPSLLPENTSGFIPYRIITDDILNVPYKSKIVSDEFRKKTIILTCNESKGKKYIHLNNAGVKIINVQSDDFGWLNMQKALTGLAENGITSVYCEGGGMLAGSLITEKLVDELQILIAPKIIGEGIFSFSGFMKSLDESINLEWQEITKMGPDVLLKGKLL